MISMIQCLIIILLFFVIVVILLHQIWNLTVKWQWACFIYYNVWLFCGIRFSLWNLFSIAAILAKVIGYDRASQDISTEKFSLERQNEIYKYEINIQTIFKRNSISGTTSSMLGRGHMMLLVPRKSLECQCPKIKLNK